MNRKYPIKMFIIGVLLNFLFHYFYLFLIGLILCIAGIWSSSCLYGGLAVLGLDLVLSIYEQMQIRKTSLSESDNQDFNEIMDAFLGPEGANGVMKIIEDKMQSIPAPEYDREQKERQELLQKLVVYRLLRDSIHEGMALEDMIDAFQQMCKTSVGEPDDLLFETGTFEFSNEKLFYFSLVRQFQFDSNDEYVQLHLDITYAPSPKTALLRGAKWSEPSDANFFPSVKNSLAFKAVQNQPILNVDIRVEDT